MTTVETNHGEVVATLTIGEGVSAVTSPCESVVLRRCQADVVFTCSAGAPAWLIDVLASWARSGTACTLRVHGQTIRMVPKQWAAETIPGRQATRFSVSLEEVMEGGAIVLSAGPKPTIHSGATCSTCGCRGSCPSKARGEVDPDAVPCARCGCRWCGPAVAGLNPPGTYRCLGCDDCVPHGTPHACRGEEAIRLREEAPLVELVKAVPDGLDPIGWRAAVLGFTDHPAPIDAINKVPRLAIALREFVTTCALTRAPAEDVAAVIVGSQLDHDMRTGRVEQALHNYTRAVAPSGPRPEPYRRRAPGLPLDAD